jgi:cytoskeletal protein RodZ
MADRTSFITADVTGTSLPHGIRCKIEFLRYALKVGHTTLSHDAAGVCPIVASGGAGLYLWMPVKPSPASPPQHNKPNESVAQPDAAQLSSNPNQLPTKEKQPMQTTSSTPFRQPVSPINVPPASTIPAATAAAATDPLQ